jgi:hypothetical protein
MYLELKKKIRSVCCAKEATEQITIQRSLHLMQLPRHPLSRLNSQTPS